MKIGKKVYTLLFIGSVTFMGYAAETMSFPFFMTGLGCTIMSLYGVIGVFDK